MHVLDGLQELVRERSGALTMLIIANRASAIRRADRIFALEDERVQRVGICDELNLNFEMQR